MNIKFKKATEKDSETILAMEKRVAGSTYHAYADVNDITLNYIIKGNAFLVLDAKDTIVGFISYELKDASLAYINDLIILPEYQNQGIGLKAMEYVMDRLRDVQKIELLTHPKNIPALRLYLKFGFEIEDWKDNIYGDGEPRLKLIKIK